MRIANCYAVTPFAPISDSAARSSLRELIPSSPNTLLTCHCSGQLTSDLDQGLYESH